ncbi:hypothetical protein GN244_ATG15123 [Phytophthora infestans]|uniref:Uncharacterized protein n=1 Tax=Phytophthora infestans TaxID=4787 RepID=A0A833STG4_PHYIN|nr:hypothetical protein GN244_ATG15123 [Phytophthora infestans]KAF4127757.1 hypothetical protein GN958_ATG22988 [Phytophthora infestans]
MTVSVDLRSRDVVLVYMYDVDMALVTAALGVSIRSIDQCHRQFKENGNVSPNMTACASAHWSAPAEAFVEGYMKRNPSFYPEELREAGKVKY